MNTPLQKIWKKLLHLRLRPIRVFCLHHVCASYDASYMYKCDWMQIDEFRRTVHNMQNKGVVFISLTDAYHHICNDWIRRERYAVLTFDDGYASLKEILPWLEEQHIPVTLFINGKYLDGKSYRDNPKEQYLTNDELFRLTSPLIEIGSHGWEHIDACHMSILTFKESVVKNIELLQAHPRYIPFYAYTYGNHMLQEDVFLKSKYLVPVFVSGEKNYNNFNYIDRELLKISNDISSSTSI